MTAVISLANVSMRFVLHHQRARSFQDALVNLVHRRDGSSEEFWALRDVSFEAQAGETVGIIGQNGSGKSTVLKLMTRILEPTAGTIDVNGRVAALIELGAGFHPDLTGRENIYLNGSILGFSRKQMDQRYDEIVAFSELERFIDTPVKHYSSGMYVRLAFSVAVTVDPDILIIDEVLAVGDESFRGKCLERIDQFRRQRKTIVVVSHALDTIQQLCDRVVWLQDGVVREQGSVSQTIHAYVESLREHDQKVGEAEQRAGKDRCAIETVAPVGSGGEVAVVSVQTMSEDRREKHNFQTGEIVVIKIRYRTIDVAGGLLYGLEVRRSDGLLVHRSEHPGSVLGNVSADDGCLEAYLVIPSLPLLAGAYDLVPIVRTPGEMLTELPGNRISVWNDKDPKGLTPVEYEWLSVPRRGGVPEPVVVR